MRLTPNSPLDVTYDGSSVVTIRAQALALPTANWTATDETSWTELLAEGYKLLAYFKATRPGSDWGCDGVGYNVQKRLGEVLLHRSGISPGNFRTGCRTYMQEVLGVRVLPEPQVQTKRAPRARAATITTKLTSKERKAQAVLIPPQSASYRSGR